MKKMTGEYGAFSKDVALHLDINKNTLRRWSLELEKHGYEFTRNEKDQRIYYQRDIVALTDFQKLLDKTQSLENTAKAIATKVRDKENADRMLSVFDESNAKVTFTKEEIEALLQQTAEETAVKTAEHLMKRFDDMIERRDKELVHSLQDSMEQRRLEIAMAEETKKVSFWSRIFGKKESNDKVTITPK